MAGLGRALLHVCLYNPLSLVGPDRLVHVARELSADVLFLPGTRVRAFSGRPYHVQRLGKATAVHFGYQKSPLSPKMAGCTIVLGRRFRAVMAMSTESAPQHIDLTLIDGYPPPPGRESSAAAPEAVQLTMDWIQLKVGECAGRSVQWLEGGDLDSDLVGMHRLQRQTAAGDRLLTMAGAGAHSLAVETSFWQHAGPIRRQQEQHRPLGHPVVGSQSGPVVSQFLEGGAATRAHTQRPASRPCAAGDPHGLDTTVAGRAQGGLGR